MTLIGYVVWTDNMRVKIVVPKDPSQWPVFSVSSLTVYSDNNPDRFKQGDEVLIEISKRDPRLKDRTL